MLLRRRINVRLIDSTSIGISFDETTSIESVIELCSEFGVEDAAKVLAEVSPQSDVLPKALARTSSYLQHPVFNKYHSETQMMRYLRLLEVNT